MFKIESSTLTRELDITDGILHTSKIINKASNLDLVPDGSSAEFEIRFIDGDSISSKSLNVDRYIEKNGKFYVRFEESCKTTVSICYSLSDDSNYLQKQLSIKQTVDKPIDYIALESIGIINSETFFTVPEIESDKIYMNLGQPFYIDSLFFGCDFPASRNGVFNGLGEVRLYIGRSVLDPIVCPKTIIGGAKSSLIVDLKSAFFEYIDSISQKNNFRVNYNPWFDCKMNIDSETIQEMFYNIESMLTSHGVAPIDSYVLDDGWNNYKGKFWNISTSKFPNGFSDVSHCAKKLSSSFGLWISPRGGYDYPRKFAKNIENGKMGYFNAEDNDICIGSKKYIKNLSEFILKTTLENDIAYWKLDGFCKNPCMNAQHDHIVGGDKNLYYMTEMWGSYIKLFKAMRAVRAKQGKDLFINLTCYVNPSPWLLQYANTIWLQEEMDIGFTNNYPQGSQSKLDAMITYRDSGYFEFLSTRAYQLPARAIFNHDPIYAREVDMVFSDDEFEKMLYWNACRGSSIMEMYLSIQMMDDNKWQSLSDVIKWQKSNFYILKHSMMLGGDPAENNIYCYAAWDKSQNGIIALRNPTNEAAALTLTLNKLMGCPENLQGVKCFNVYNKSSDNFDREFDYNDKMELTLNPFEIKIFQFAKTEPKNTKENVNDFTISFDTDGHDGTICRNNDIAIGCKDGYLLVNISSLKFKSESVIRSSKHRITIVRSKNKMVKLYIDRFLDCSAYDENQAAEISIDLSSVADNFKVTGKATPFSDIISLKEQKSKKSK